jgi:phosphatidylserine/phosphatidylglycerophosphate/cardiolipin synthase-like enzyme
MFYPKADYFRAVTRDIVGAKRGDRILLTTMNFDPRDPLARDIVTELIAASKRGAKVNLAIDAHDFLQTNKLHLGPLWFHTEMPAKVDAQSRQRLALGEALRATGGVFAITNQPHRAHSSPVSGRSHIKAAIINDKIYLGGCNLNNANQLDLMISWYDATTADWLYTTLKTMVDTENTKTAFHGIDQSFAVDSRTTLLIDAGVRQQSRIFDEALAFIDEAQDWLAITCQFFPHGITAEHLARASRRGVHIKIMYNRPYKHGAYAPIQQGVVWRERLRGRPASFFASALPTQSPYIHAKLIASEKGAIIGSHNYVAEGVKFGTAEIALLRHDAAFGLEALATIEHAIQTAKR